MKKTPSQRHPILSIAFVISKLGRVPREEVLAYALTFLEEWQFDQIISKLVDLRNVQVDGDDLVWTGPPDLTF